MPFTSSAALALRQWLYSRCIKSCTRRRKLMRGAIITPEATRILTDLYDQEYPRIANSWHIKRTIRWNGRGAEDIAADALSDLAEELSQGKIPADPAKRLWRLAENLAQRARRESTAGPMLYGSVEDMHPAAEIAVEDQSEAAWLGMYDSVEWDAKIHPDPLFPEDFDAALRELPEPERSTFILTELRGLDQTEAATLLGVSQPTVSRRHTAARSHIRKGLS